MCNVKGMCRLCNSLAKCDRWPTYKCGQLHGCNCTPTHPHTHTHTHTPHTHTHTTLHNILRQSRNYLYTINAKEHKNVTPRQILPEEAVVITAYVVVFKGTLVTI